MALHHSQDYPADALFSLIPRIMLRKERVVAHTGPSYDLVKTITAEYSKYAERLEGLQQQLEQKIQDQDQLFSSERELVEKNCALHKEKIEAELMARSFHDVKGGQPPTPSISMSMKNTCSELSDGDRVVQFWREKCLTIESRMKEVAEKNDMVNSKIEDYRFLQQSDQYKVHRWIGLLREREATERTFADSYAAMIRDLRLNSKNDEEIASGLSTESDPLSCIHKQLSSEEENSLKKVIHHLELHLDFLQKALNFKQFREEQIRKHASECDKMANPQSIALEALVEEVLDLRTQAAESQKERTLDGRCATDIQKLANTIEELQQKMDSMEEQMLRELRERRVAVIRTLHQGSSDPGARFRRLQADQSVAIVGRQIAVAEAEKQKLAKDVQSLSLQAQQKAQFIGRCT